MPAAADNENSANLTRVRRKPRTGLVQSLRSRISRPVLGPFIAVYLSSQSWTQTSIGLALSIGTISSMASQVPAARWWTSCRTGGVAAFSVLVFMVSAVDVRHSSDSACSSYLGEILHGISSWHAGPRNRRNESVIAGRFAMGLRLGRNARYAAIGNGVGAALMGACGQYVVGARGILFDGRILTLPALFALLPLRGPQLRAASCCLPRESGREPRRISATCCRSSPVDFFRLCDAVHFANAPLLMLISGTLTAKGSNPSLLIAACIVLPQIIVALASPSVGRLANAAVRRIVLTIGLSMLPLRACCSRPGQNPTLLVTVQVLDGVAAACFGIMVPLIVSDVAAGRAISICPGRRRFGIGIGGTLSSRRRDGWRIISGGRLAFFALTGIGLAAVLVALVMRRLDQQGSGARCLWQRCTRS